MITIPPAETAGTGNLSPTLSVLRNWYPWFVLVFGIPILRGCSHSTGVLTVLAD